MPITLTTAQHSARRWQKERVSDANKLFEMSCPRHYRRNKNILQHSFSSKPFGTENISSSPHGFVWSVIEAYSGHHHLTIRPEDVWFSILTQLSFYVVANAEELRSFFVSHDGSKTLRVTRPDADYGAFASQMTDLIQENVVDPELRGWIIPDFSTTNEEDQVVASILMMGSLQKYFRFEFEQVCGIPTVTLLGKRDDWARILNRLDKLDQLGEEAAQFGRLLRPALKGFIACFDQPTGPDVVDFWSKCAHRISYGSGSPDLSGWITAFCFWDEDGRRLDHDGPRARSAGCDLDGVLFHMLPMKKIPAGFASVPVKVIHYGEEFEAEMVAGLVGIQSTSSGQILDTSEGHGHQRSQHLAGAASATGDSGKETGLDSIQPLSGWWMYESEGREEEEARQREIKRLTSEMNELCRGHITFSPQEEETMTNLRNRRRELMVLEHVC